MKILPYLFLSMVLISGCTLLYKYIPIENLNYTISDEKIIYLTDKLLISAKGYFYFNEQQLLNSSLFDLTISTKTDTLKLFLNRVVLNDITNSTDFELDHIYLANEKRFVVDSIMIYPNQTKVLNYEFSKIDSVLINLMYYNAELKIEKLYADGELYNLPAFKFVTEAP